MDAPNQGLRTEFAVQAHVVALWGRGSVALSLHKSDGGMLTSIFGMVLAVAAILVIMADRDLAQPSLSPIYHPQLLLLY
jgi:hypothetical protein